MREGEAEWDRSEGSGMYVTSAGDKEGRRMDNLCKTAQGVIMPMDILHQPHDITHHHNYAADLGVVDAGAPKATCQQ